MVRHWFLVPAFGGSNPSALAKTKTSALVGVFVLFGGFEKPSEAFGVRNASGISQGSPLLQTSLQRSGDRPAEGRSNPSALAKVKRSPFGGRFTFSGWD